MSSPALSPVLSPTALRCDGHLVGVIITDRAGRVLLGDRTDGAGVAAVAGHVFDAHGCPGDAAVAEVAEEVGLAITELVKMAVEWRPNRCLRGPGPHGPGHYWTLYRALVTGPMHVDPKSFTGVRWAGPGEVEEFAQRSLAYARGEVSEVAWRERPGIELVWVRWLAVTRLLVTVSADELEEIEAVLDEGVVAGAGG